MPPSHHSCKTVTDNHITHTQVAGESWCVRRRAWALMVGSVTHRTVTRLADHKLTLDYVRRRALLSLLLLLLNRANCFWFHRICGHLCLKVIVTVKRGDSVLVVGITVCLFKHGTSFSQSYLLCLRLIAGAYFSSRNNDA